MNIFEKYLIETVKNRCKGQKIDTVFLFEFTYCGLGPFQIEVFYYEKDYTKYADILSITKQSTIVTHEIDRILI